MTSNASTIPVSDEALNARPAQPPKDLPIAARAAIGTFFNHASPLILSITLIWDAGWRLWLGNWRWLDLWVALALFGYWPINEWLIHVFILHNPPRQIGGWRFDYLVARSHCLLAAQHFP